MLLDFDEDESVVVLQQTQPGGADAEGLPLNQLVTRDGQVIVSSTNGQWIVPPSVPTIQGRFSSPDSAQQDLADTLALVQDFQFYTLDGTLQNGQFILNVTVGGPFYGLFYRVIGVPGWVPKGNIQGYYRYRVTATRFQ